MQVRATGKTNGATNRKKKKKKPMIFWEMIQFDEHIFQMGWFNHQLDYFEEPFLGRLLVTFLERLLVTFIARR